MINGCDKLDKLNETNVVSTKRLASPTLSQQTQGTGHLCDIGDVVWTSSVYLDTKLGRLDFCRN